VSIPQETVCKNSFPFKSYSKKTGKFFNIFFPRKIQFFRFFLNNFRTVCDKIVKFCWNVANINTNNKKLTIDGKIYFKLPIGKLSGKAVFSTITPAKLGIFPIFIYRFVENYITFLTIYNTCSFPPDLSRYLIFS
jgi:hypothetical protein